MDSHTGDPDSASSGQTPGTRSGPDRRTLLRGTAWSIPVVAAAAAAPSFAASPTPTLRHLTDWHWYSNNAPWCAGSFDGISLNTTATGTGVTVTNTTATTTIVGVSAYFWFARNDVAFVSNTGNSGCWTVPTADGTTTTSGGVTYYRYLSTYTCAIVATAGTTTLQNYSWRSQCYNLTAAAWAPMQTARRQAFATINGTQQSTDTGFFLIQG